MTAHDPGNTSIISDHRYRPEIDGLRAVAVLLVVLYHAGLGVPGGYIGVDVFFVISGFLIGSLIWKDVQAGRFSLVQFWERRARRIIPALAVMCLCTLLAGWFLLMPFDFENLGRSAAAQALFTANIYFRKRIGYFSESLDHEPLLHTWSLAVEEQYYLVGPLAVVGLYFITRQRTRGVLLGLMIALIVGSLALSMKGVSRQSPSAFYDLPSRLWELLLGGVLALFPVALFAERTRWRELAAMLGFALILVPAFLYDSKTPFPGLAAVPPCIGAALIIAANGASLTATDRALSLRPMVFVGLISYSLYLWHWPILVLADYRLAEPPSPVLRAALVAAAAAIAIASWRWVETPFRRRRLCPSRRSIFILAGASLACVFAASRVIIAMEGFPERFLSDVTKHLDVKKDPAFDLQVDIKRIESGDRPRFGSRTPDAPIRLLIWGDSHAMTALPAFGRLCKERGVAGRIAAYGGYPPLLGYFAKEQDRHTKVPHNDAVFAYIQANRIPDVVLIAFWEASPPKGAAESPALDEALLNTVRRLVQAGVRPWVLLQVPECKVDVPRAMARAVAFGQTVPSGAKPTRFNGIVGKDPGLLDALTAAGATIIDPRPAFLDPTGDHYIMSSEGTALYMDSNHLTGQGAIQILLPVLRETFTVGVETPVAPSR